MILNRLFRPTVERRSLAAPAQWLVDALGGESSAAGETVSPSGALSVAAYYACIRAIAEDVAKLPLNMYRRLDRGKEKMSSDPLQRILHDAPNDEMTAFSLRETLTSHALGWGNGYAEITRLNNRPDGIVRSLVPLPPDKVTPTRNDAGEIVYKYNQEAGGERIIPSAFVLHVHGLGFDGLMGYSVANVGKETVGAAMATQKFRGAFFKNGTRNSALLSFNKPLTPERQNEFRKSWESMHSKAENAHKVAIVSGADMNYHALSVNPEDAQMIETSDFNVVDICRWFRMPPHKVQQLDRATFSNIEHQAIEYATDTLLPWLVRWEQEIKRKLIRPVETDVFAEHVMEGILRGDTQSRYEAYTKGRQWGWLSANDVLELENRNPIGEQGDIYMVPANMWNAEDVAAGNVPASQPASPPSRASMVLADQVRRNVREGGDTVESVVATHEPLLIDALRRLMQTERDKVQRAIRRGEGEAWIGAFYASHKDHVIDSVTPIIEAVCHAVRLARDTDLLIEPRTIAWNMAQRHIAESQRLIESGAFWDESRATVAAREEIEQLCDAVMAASDGV